MKKNLVAFLGNAQYQETTYQIEDKLYKNQLAFIPVYKHFSPIETVYVIGTKGSRWEMLKDFPHKPIEIPYGRSESDFWKMFDILTNNLELKNTDVIFDITHCFRAIPVFTAIYIRFIRYIEPTANFSHIFYGSFEKEQPITPIVDLAPVLELLDWIEAATSFIKYGELEELSMKVKTKNDKAWKQNVIEKPKTLGEFSKRLQRLSNLSRLTYVPLLSETSKELSILLNRIDFKEEIQRHVKPFSLLSDSLVRYTSRFAKSSFWESHLEAAKWYLENKRPTQALLVLREIILTYLCEKDGCDPYDFKSRDIRERELNEQRNFSKKPLVYCPTISCTL
ncbi:MAG: TIGR02221 family CRISPR-associated protein [Nitrospirota bacterium]